MVLPRGSTVICYARDSGGDDQSIEDQVNALREYCDETGLVIDRLFEDRATPGSSTTGRSQFRAMINFVRSAPEDTLPAGVVFWSFSRFSRDYDDAAFYTADLRRHGLKLVSVSDDIPDGSFARIVESLIHWQNEHFLDQLSKDVSRGLRDLAKQGYAPGGFPPRGYKAEKVEVGQKNDGTPRMASQWVPDPEKAPLIRKAFRMRANGASYREILEETGVYGSSSSLSSCFRNETYLGIRKCDDLRIEDAHEALVSQELWDAVQETLIERPASGDEWPEGQPHPRSQRSKHGPYLLSGIGILYCAYCGSALYGGTDNVNSRPGDWPYYLCCKKKNQGWDSCKAGKIDQRVVNSAVIETVADHVLDEDYVWRIVEATNRHLDQGLDGLDQQINQVQAELAQADRAIDALLDVVGLQGVDANVRARLEAQGQRKERLRARLELLRAKRDQQRIEVDEAQVRRFLSEAREGLSGDDILARRALVRRFVQRIEAGKEKGRLWAAFPIDELDLTGLWMVPPREEELNPCHPCQCPSFVLAW
jgi:DNA invertase Pin-like site-specific DNA recombinase